MADFAANWYLWIKAVHILAVIAWVAGLLMMPRYFVYHADTAPGSESSNLLLTMEGKLRKIILAPSIVLVWAFGLTLAAMPGVLAGSIGWFHVKLTAVVLLSAYHGYLMMLFKQFQRGERKHSHKFYRAINEIPFLLAIIAVFMVVLKPF